MADPPLKLVLMEGAGIGGTIKHLGMEVSSADDVATAHDRLARAGLATEVEREVACCYAVQDKVWVEGPDAEPWEIYSVLSDAGAPPRRATTMGSHRPHTRPRAGVGCPSQPRRDPGR